jgi:SAM-dependent methyltransferase
LADGIFCRKCAVHYPAVDGKLDLRIRTPLGVAFTATIGIPVEDSLSTVRLDPNPHPAVDIADFPLPKNVSYRFASYLPKAPHPDSRVLDVGCGDAVDRPLLEHAGYRWYGIDYYDDRAPVLADAHALPFKDETFDLVFSVAVIECLQYPQLAMREAARVLRPGGHVMASVAFLTPYIPLTQFHWSYVGALNVLRAAGLTVELISADRDWTLLEAGAHVGLFPRMPSRLATAIVRPLNLLHRLWWRIAALRVGRPLPERERVLRNAGDVEFVATKPVTDREGR